MKTTPAKGTNDYSTRQAKLRTFMQDAIFKTYSKQGFNRIITPDIEDIENLEKSDGGDNLNLIFKVLKRGDKLSTAIEQKDYEHLADLGLRYDLTLPLSRFFAGHRNELYLPFKVIQMGNVFRAERPQKGRNREFVQCDIDIIGSKSIDCEIELIDTTAQALLNFNLKNFTIRINDRHVLKSVLASFGFEQNDFDSVCTSFDKLDKIGIDGVRAELEDKNFSKNSIKSFCDMLSNLPKTPDDVRKICGDKPEIAELEKIISSVESLADGKYKIKFDLSLVRGQSYYTGPVFEIQSGEYSCSIGGGGRYDKLIGKFCGQDVCAVGFSIGFERLFDILDKQNFVIPDEPKKVAIIYMQGDIVKAMKFSKEMKREYSVAIFECPKSLGKLLSRLQADGFVGYCDLQKSENIKFFD